MTVAEAAFTVGVSPKLIYAAIRAGRLKVARIGAGRNMRVGRRHLEDFTRTCRKRARI